MLYFTHKEAWIFKSTEVFEVLIQIKELLNNQEIQKQTQQVVTSINECLHILGSRVETKTLVAAYMLYKVRVS